MKYDPYEGTSREGQELRDVPLSILSVIVDTMTGNAPIMSIARRRSGKRASVMAGETVWAQKLAEKKPDCCGRFTI